MAINNAAAALIGATVTLVLVIIFMILMVVLVRQCLAFFAKRSAIRAQAEAHRARAELDRQRRTSITEPVPATFDWHHSIRIAGTPPPSYREAKKLPPLQDGVSPSKKKKRHGQSLRGGDKGNGDDSDSSTGVGPRGSMVEATDDGSHMASVSYREFEDSVSEVAHRRDVDVSINMESDQQVNGHLDGGRVGSTNLTYGRESLSSAGGHDGTPRSTRQAHV